MGWVQISGNLLHGHIVPGYCSGRGMSATPCGYLVTLGGPHSLVSLFFDVWLNRLVIGGLTLLVVAQVGNVFVQQGNSRDVSNR